MFKIKAQNAFSFQEMEFDFSDLGLCLVQGVNRDSAAAKSNGAGKSSLLDILCWGLYGKCLRLSDVDKIVNNQVGKDCVVEVWWEQYHIARYRKHTKHKNDVQFWNGTSEETGKSNAETQLAIDKALGLVYETFVKAIYFQQNTLTSFARAKDSEQKVIIEDILGLNILSDTQKRCKDKVKIFDTDIEVATKELQTIELRKDEARRRVQQVEMRTGEWERNHKNSLQLGEIKVAEIQAKLTVETESFDFVQAKAAIAATDNITKEVAELEAKIYILNSRKNEQLSNRRIIDMRLKDVENLQERNISDRDRLSTTPNPKCPTCGKDMDAMATAKRIHEMDLNIQKVTQQIVDSRKALADLPDGVDVDSEIASFKEQIGNKKQLVEMSQKLHLRVNEEEYKLKEREILNGTLADARFRLEDLRKQTNPYTSEMAEEVVKGIGMENEMKGLRSKLLKLADDRAYYDYWVDGLSNSRLKSYIMDSITPILNERANHYSKFLTGGEIEIEISTQTKLKSGEMRDKFSVNTTSVNGVDYEQSSGGQRKRIDIAILLALQELVASRAVNPLKLMIVDELSENLDSVGLERLLDLLKEIANDKGSLLYVTHDEDLQSLFPNNVTVVMEKGVSRIT